MDVGGALEAKGDAVVELAYRKIKDDIVHWVNFFLRVVAILALSYFSEQYYPMGWFMYSITTVILGLVVYFQFKETALKRGYDQTTMLCIAGLSAVTGVLFAYRTYRQSRRVQDKLVRENRLDTSRVKALRQRKTEGMIQALQVGITTPLTMYYGGAGAKNWWGQFQSGMSIVTQQWQHARVQTEIAKGITDWVNVWLDNDDEDEIMVKQMLSTSAPSNETSNSSPAAPVVNTEASPEPVAQGKEIKADASEHALFLKRMKREQEIKQIEFDLKLCREEGAKYFGVKDTKFNREHTKRVNKLMHDYYCATESLRVTNERLVNYRNNKYKSDTMSKQMQPIVFVKSSDSKSDEDFEEIPDPLSPRDIDELQVGRQLVVDEIKARRQKAKGSNWFGLRPVFRNAYERVRQSWKYMETKLLHNEASMLLNRESSTFSGKAKRWFVQFCSGRFTNELMLKLSTPFIWMFAYIVVSTRYIRSFVQKHKWKILFGLVFSAVLGGTVYAFRRNQKTMVKEANKHKGKKRKRVYKRTGKDRIPDEVYDKLMKFAKSHNISDEEVSSKVRFWLVDNQDTEEFTFDDILGDTFDYGADVDDQYKFNKENMFLAYETSYKREFWPFGQPSATKANNHIDIVKDAAIDRFLGLTYYHVLFDGVYSAVLRGDDGEVFQLLSYKGLDDSRDVIDEDEKSFDTVSLELARANLDKVFAKKESLKPMSHPIDMPPLYELQTDIGTTTCVVLKASSRARLCLPEHNVAGAKEAKIITGKTSNIILQDVQKSAQYDNLYADASGLSVSQYGPSNMRMPVPGEPLVFFYKLGGKSQMTFGNAINFIDFQDDSGKEYKAMKYTGSTVDGSCGGIYVSTVDGCLVGIHGLGGRTVSVSNAFYPITDAFKAELNSNILEPRMKYSSLPRSGRDVTIKSASNSAPVSLKSEARQDVPNGGGATRS